MSHAPIVFRLISLRLVNVEAQERTFAQMKQITKATSSNQPNHVITNILIRMKEEGKSKTTNSIEAQENEIGKIARVVGKANNTVIPHTWCRAHPTRYQAHLERISDFLALGPGIWWEETSSGFEFYDGDDSSDYHYEGPQPQHYRSATLPDVLLLLIQKWDECLKSTGILPAYILHQYTECGTLSHIHALTCPETSDPTKEHT